MKTLLFFLLLLVNFSGSAQKTGPEFFSGVEYFTSNKIKLSELLPATTGMDSHHIIYDGGEINLIVGIRYSPVKFLEAGIKTDTYMNFNSVFSYSPVSASYTASMKLLVSKMVNIKVEHACFHPLDVDGRIHNKLLGGYTKFGIYWNMK